MTATNDAPDSPAQDRWQHLEDRLAAVELRIREQSTATLGVLDTHLARLDALRRQLAGQSWPPQGPDVPGGPDRHPGPSAGAAR
ncbi:hypothetical protein AB0F71_14465 [Kitasatospora sp. NPDC028055]|uniref:hypothetical protein n=1 Tax=Kitasatospora sp. NPDC028055 TaxID=3155653 RepID=UPI0033F06628